MGDQEQTFKVVQGDGYAVGHIDAMGEGYGFRKIRRELDVSEFGVNALVLPPRYEAPAHYHERQQEIYFIHRGEVEFEFADGSRHSLGTGGVARVDPATVRQLRNRGSEEAVLVIVGAADGYVGRDGRPPSEPRPGGPLQG